MSITNSKNTPKTEILRRNNGRRHSCQICRSERENEVNTGYSRGYGLELLSKMYGFNIQSIRTHVRALGLDERRDMATLTKVRKILNSGLKYIDTTQPGDALMSKCLELEAKLTGELDERPVQSTNILTITTTEREDRLRKGLEAFGVRVQSKAVAVEGDRGGVPPPDESAEAE